MGEVRTAPAKRHTPKEWLSSLPHGTFPPFWLLRIPLHPCPFLAASLCQTRGAGWVSLRTWCLPPTLPIPSVPMFPLQSSGPSAGGRSPLCTEIGDPLRNSKKGGLKNNSLHSNIISLFRKGTLWPTLISTPLTRGPLVLIEEDKGCTLSSPQHSLRTPCPQASGAVHRVLAALLKGDKMKLHLLSP